MHGTVCFYAASSSKKAIKSSRTVGRRCVHLYKLVVMAQRSQDIHALAMHRLAPMPAMLLLFGRPLVFVSAMIAFIKTPQPLLVPALPPCFNAIQMNMESVRGLLQSQSLAQLNYRLGTYPRTWCDEKHPCRAMFAVQPVVLSVVSSHQLLRRCLSGFDSKN